MTQVRLKIAQCTIERCRVAKSFWERFRGLMLRPPLAADEAMLFPRCSSIHTFFMRFTIDVVFVDSHWNVTHVFRNLRPWRLTLPRKGMVHAVEFLAGRAAGIEVGQKIQIEGNW